MIIQSGEYDLATDVGPCLPGVDGIQILASDVTLHLNGHTIDGSAAPATCNSSVGIRVGLPSPAMLTKVLVHGDGTISDFRIGFLANRTSGSFVKRVAVTAQCPFFSYGFVIQLASSQWKLDGNVVREPGQTSSGILLGAAADDNVLVRNDVNDTINIFGSNNTVVNNVASDNDGGIILYNTADNNDLHANTTNNNRTNSGLWIQLGSTGNNITGNKSFNNLPFDARDDNLDCDANKWEGNHFDTANQACID
jgi:parallel beta-helix repeat protein